VKSNALLILLGVMMLEGSAAAQQPSLSSGKIAATAIVVLTHEFCTVEVKRGNWGVGNEVFRPGLLICPSAEEAVRNSFERVIRMETAPKPEDAGGHLVLIPRYADMEATTTATTIGKRNIALLLEWRAIEPSGKILWVQTVEGDARKATGLNHQKLLQMVARDLAAKSTEAIEKSQEIRQFLETRLGK
jgi:hypothetical protein